jgi:hypothetical protein
VIATPTPSSNSHSQEPPNDQYSQLGGWLILAGFHLVWLVLGSVIGLIPSASLLLATVRYGSQEGFSLVCLGHLAAAVIGLSMAPLSILAAMHFFRRKRRAPVFFISLFIAYAFATVGMAYSLGAEARLLIHAVGYLATAILWGSYFFVSKRVKRTFVC